MPANRRVDIVGGEVATFHHEQTLLHSESGMGLEDRRNPLAKMHVHVDMEGLMLVRRALLGTGSPLRTLQKMNDEPLLGVVEKASCFFYSLQ